MLICCCRHCCCRRLSSLICIWWAHTHTKWAITFTSHAYFDYEDRSMYNVYVWVYARDPLNGVALTILVFEIQMNKLEKWKVLGVLQDSHCRSLFMMNKNRRKISFLRHFVTSFSVRCIQHNSESRQCVPELRTCVCSIFTGCGTKHLNRSGHMTFWFYRRRKQHRAN